MIHASRIRTLFTLVLFLVLGICEARATSFFVDNATQFNALTDRSGASFATLNAGDRVYLKGGTAWGGLVVTLTGSMTDAQAQSNPAVVYACDASYNPTVGGVTVTDLCAINFAGTGIVFTGVVFGPSSGMYLTGSNPNNDYAGATGHIFEMLPASRYMSVSHCKFDNCGFANTSPNNAHYGPWIYIYGYHHTVQYCELSGRSFNSNDVNQTDKNLRTSIRDATIVIYIDTVNDTNYGYHAVRYNYFGERKVPNSNGTSLYQPAAGIASLSGCAITSGSTTVTCSSTAGITGSGTGVTSGWVLSGPNVPSGATVVSVTDATHLVMSAPAAITASSLTWTATEAIGDFALPNGWESIRMGNGSISTLSMNATVEYNVFYHSIYSANSPALPTDSPGEPEAVSNKSCNNTYRYNTFLNNYGSLTLRQGDYCVAHGNCFLGGGAYDANGGIVTTEPLNDQMGGIRVIGFGNTVSNNYFYKINGTGGICALSLYRGFNPPTVTNGASTILNNIDGLNGYETANYTQVFGNTFIDCLSLNLDNTASGQSNAVNATQFFNNLVYYSGAITNSTGTAATGISGGFTDALVNHGGQAGGNYLYSATAGQFGNAAAMLGAGNTITTSASPLLTGSYNGLSIPAANSPVVGQAVAEPIINDTSTTGSANNLAGNVATYAALDLRNLSRPATGRDIGDYQQGLTGTGVRPLRRTEVGIVAATYPNYPVVNESFPNNTRTVQNPPASLDWFCSGVSGNNTPVSSGTLTLTSSSVSRQAVAYFPAQSLNVGDVLTLSFNFTVTGPLNLAKGLHAALLSNGANTLITSDQNANPGSYTGTGYGTFCNPAPTTANPVSLVKRGATAGTIVTTPVGTTWPALASGGITQSLVAGTTYTATLTVRRSGTAQAVVSTTYSGGTLTSVSVTATDSSSIITTFDTLALGVGNTTAASIAYSNISVTKNTPLLATTDAVATGQNSVVDINLQTLTGDATSPFLPLTFSVSSALNGTVTLLADGVTARFTPTNNYLGSAGFSYTVSDGTNTTGSAVALTYGNLQPATVTLSNLAPTYDGTAKAATATTSPAGLSVSLTYNGSTTAPTNAGSYNVTGVIVSSTYEGQSSDTLVISQAPATVTLGSLTQIYDGSPKSVTTTTVPASLSCSLAYFDSGGNPLASAPSAAGIYTVAGTINETNYTGSARGTLQIYGAPVAAATTLGTSYNSPATLDLLTLAGDAVTARGKLRFTVAAATGGTATLNADGHTVTFTPTAAGTASFSYTVTNTAPDARTLLNYSFQETLSGATCTDVSGNGRDGTFIDMTGAGAATYVSDYPTTLFPQMVQSCNLYQNANTDATKLVAGLAGVSTLNFQTADWTAAGWFKRSSTADEDIVFHLGAGIGNGATNDFTLAFSGTNDALALKNWNTTSTSSTPDVNIATTATSGAWHHFAIVRGGTTLTLYVDGVSIGSSSAFALTFDPTTASVATFGAAAGSASTYLRAFNGSMADLGIFNAALTAADVTKLYAAPTANLGGQSASNTVTYTVSAIAPAAPTAVSATAGNTQATVSFTAPGSNGGAAISSYTATASPGGAFATGAASPLTVTGLTNGTVYTFTVTATNTAGTGAASSPSSSVTPIAPATVTLGSLLQVYDGYARAATASTSPSGLNVIFTYNGSSTVPTAIGSYTVVGTVNDASYGGSATGTLVITDVVASLLTSGTWICPANVTSIQVECWGGGGAGGSALKNTSSAFGGGGAGGAYARVNALTVTPNTSYTVSIGTGGVSLTTPDLATVPGSDSSFSLAASTLCLAKGGAGGQTIVNSGASGRAGLAGTGSATGCTGDTFFAGGSGYAGQGSSGVPTASSGGGGGGSAGTSGAGLSATDVPGAAAVAGGGAGGAGKSGGNGNGTAGGLPGGGGGGARGSSTGTQAIGGNGSAGQIVVTVKKFLAAMTLANLAQTFDGTPKAATASTFPSGLTVTYAYNGSATAPTAAGSYTVIATVTDASYSGSTTGTLVIAAPITSWRQLYFGTTASTGAAADSADPDGDGLTNVQEYTLGTNPASANNAALLSATRSGANITLTFTALQATGTGYAGLTRHYAIESTTDLTPPASWSAVTGYADIVVSNQAVTATVAAAGARSFFRLKAWLQ